jgi:soluble lytic murein transglycosylase-like protein
MFFLTLSQPDMNRLLAAIAQVESSGNPLAYNKKENAAGLYQIRPIYLRDVNRILGQETYTLADRFDPVKAQAIVTIYLAHYGKGKTLEQLARIHNGGNSGDKKASTLKYWQKVKAIL